MKAVTWCGKQDVRVQEVPEPKLLNPRDAIVKVTATAICGSDLQLYNGRIPTMEAGDILGHEFMGQVVEVGPGVKNLKVGDRVVVPFTIACGHCFFCQHQLWSLCDNSNPNAALAEKLMGYSPSGLFGHTHMMGGYAGGQAEYVRVPFADVGPLKIPEGLGDEQVVFLSDSFPTGYQAAENCNIHSGDVVAVWGCGPVGQLAIKSAHVLGAYKVIAIDSVPRRLQMAEEKGGAIAIHMNDEYIYERLKDLTGGRGPDSCIDAVGMEAHGATLDGWYDQVKTALGLASDPVHALRQAINCCRKGGTVAIAGVYAGYAHKIPVGALMNKALTIKTGQTYVMRYMRPLLQRIQEGKIDPSFIITHRLALADAPRGYELFRNQPEECVKVLLKPS